VVDNAPGRHFYACHLTFEDQPGVQRLVRGYQAALAGLDGLDLIPGRYLLVLDMDLLALGEEFDLEQVNYLATRAD
jgi:hypothetical protein